MQCPYCNSKEVFILFNGEHKFQDNTLEFQFMCSNCFEYFYGNYELKKISKRLGTGAVPMDEIDELLVAISLKE